MKQHLNQLRPATAALFAALVLPTAPVFAQDTLTAPPPPVIVAPPPVIAAPPPVTATPAPPPVATPRVTPRPTPAPAPVARSTTRTTTRTTTTRTAAPAGTATRAPAPAAAPAPAPVAQAPAETASPPAPIETLPPPAAPEETVPAGQAQSTAPRTPLPWIIGGGLLLLALISGYLLFFSRRRTDEVYETHYEPAPPREEVAREPSFVPPIEVAPVAAAEPVFFRPVADPVPEPRAAMQPVADEPTALPPPEEVSVAEADQADIEALAASSAPVAGRPWLEFLMRPLRAGTNRDNTIVQFELTVGNTGNVDARNVRISTWVVAAGEGTDMERSLIVPADAHVEAVNIDAGEGATVEAKIGLAKDGIDETVLPVVVADARYTLPDGTEGRTHASFAVGVPAAESGELEPFLTDRSSGLRENVEARLYGEPERV
jgi:Meckel syndrome type 1 protein